MDCRMRRVALYVRVSTAKGQTTGSQKRRLREVARNSGWTVAKIYEDTGISGARGRDRRPALDELLKDATAREFDIVAAFSLDRIGRSMQHLVSFLGEIRALGIGLYVHDQHLDTSTPIGEMIFHVAGAFAQFERRLIQERVRAGLERARSRGKRLGRPTVGVRKESAIRASLDAGNGVLKTARVCGVGTSVVQRLKKEQVRTGA